jgi:hypothetical protein
MVICRGDIVAHKVEGHRGRVLDVWAATAVAWLVWEHHQHESLPVTLAGAQTCIPLVELEVVEKGDVGWLFV